MTTTATRVVVWMKKEGLRSRAEMLARALHK